MTGSTDRIPCPMCGSENDAASQQCTVCGYGMQATADAGRSTKCARCGSQVPGGYDFCPVCGLDQRRRLARPATQIVGIDQEPDEPTRREPGAPPPRVAPPPVVGPAHPGAVPNTPPGPFPGAAPPQLTVPAPSGHAPSPLPHPAPAPVLEGGPQATPGTPSPVAPAKTGRTVFADGPPLPRPPEGGPAEVESTIPAAGRGVKRSEDEPTVPFRSDSAAMHDLVRGNVNTNPHADLEDAHPTLEGDLPYWQEGSPGAHDVPDALPSDRPTNLGVGAARVVVVGRDGEEGESFPVPGPTVTIGRQQGDIIFPDDNFMSAAHARLERIGDTFTLVDLGSPNGVYKRIRGSSPAFPGDLFMVGHQVLRLENITESVEEQPPSGDGTRLFGTPLKPAWAKLALVGRGGVPGDTYYLRGAKVVFGREQGDILFPQDPFVSREHARLRLEIHGTAMSVFLEDLGSANGTYIRIRGNTELRGRDTFRIGDQILRLRLDR